MKILSLFDGISCGRVALERAGIPVEKYYASEIDKYAIRVAQKNYPDTIQVGDVTQIDGSKFRDIDILIGGSPCQGFSFAGKQLNFEDPRSKLFFEYVRILNEIKPKYFLLENVCMKKECEDVISQALGVFPMMINSSLVSAQNRKRLYWTNISKVTRPKDRGIVWGDVREHGVPSGAFYYTDKAKNWIHRHEERTGKKLKIFDDGDKMQMLEASMHKKYSSQRFFGINDTYGIRYITPLECERCQTLPDEYTSCVSNTQRYIQLGNGWTVDVVAHILGFVNT
ncbi:Modification methylase HpaII [bioreactor metagenome]|uniref:DNA (cytosine-5-)-methyltransferase n=1 Tax=bioreactor metagenome TaxID=1076179 RepID=A0A644WAN8_9ZZZZ